MNKESIFLSYAGVDRDTATHLKDELILAGLNQKLWQDIDQIRGGDNWLLKLEEALQESCAYLILLGPSGIHKWVKFELYLAIRRHFDSDERYPIVPVLLPGADLEAVPSFLSIFQAEKLNAPLDATSYQKLAVSISRQINYPSEGSQIKDIEISSQCPWPGLISYDETWSRFFFGRPTEILEAIRLLGDSRDGYYRRWLQIEGPSGVGKSSLVLAGLVPAIQKGWLGENEPVKPKNWLIAKMRPGSDPIDGLAVSLAIALDNWRNQADELKLKLQNGNSETLKLIVKEASERATPKRPLLLIVDQMEELFAASINNSQCIHFDQLLTNAIMDRTGPLHLITTIRSDFTLKQQESLVDLSSNINTLAERYYLGPITKAGLRDVVKSPAKLAGLTWDEKTLPERVIEDAAENPNPLPLVSHLLYLLWHKRQGNKLIGQVYKDLNGVGGALSTSADELWKSLNNDGRSRAKKLLLRLVSVGKDRPNTRRTISLSTALRAAGDDDLAREIVDQLSGRVSSDVNLSVGPRLIYVRPRIEGCMTNDDQRFLVDVAHEALLTRWELFKEWLADPVVREQLESEEELEKDASDWELEGKPHSIDLPNSKKLERYLQSCAPSLLADEYLTVLKAEQQKIQYKLLLEQRNKDKEAAEKKALENQIKKTRKFWRIQLPVGVLALMIIGFLIYSFQYPMRLIRNNYTVCVTSGFSDGDNCSRAAIIHHAPSSSDEYSLGFIEFDDQGELFDPKQADAVLEHYYQLASNRSVLIVTYVHGWRHSARNDDSDVREFRRLLSNLSKRETSLGHREIIGLYIGWRGGYSPVPFMNYVEFWKQNNTANKIGSRATFILRKLARIFHDRSGQVC